MGKASRRKGADKKSARAARVPFTARPFDGLAGETEWVAMREILPAATARVSFAHEGQEGTATIATVLPLAWAGLHRDDGELLVATQSGAGSGDLSRDLAAALLETAELGPGVPLAKTPTVTADTPRLQDVLTGDDPMTVRLYDGFDFWMAEGADQDEATRASLEQANAAISPTEALPAAQSAYWCRIGARTYVRWVLPDGEDEAVAALARLHAAGRGSLGEGRLLGAFRTCGLLVPVWEVDPGAPAASYDEPMGALAQRFADALASVRAGEELTDEERRARAGLISRQITIR